MEFRKVEFNWQNQFSRRINSLFIRRSSLKVFCFLFIFVNYENGIIIKLVKTKMVGDLIKNDNKGPSLFDKLIIS